MQSVPLFHLPPSNETIKKSASYRSRFIAQPGTCRKHSTGKGPSRVRKRRQSDSASTHCTETHRPVLRPYSSGSFTCIHQIRLSVYHSLTCRTRMCLSLNLFHSTMKRLRASRGESLRPHQKNFADRAFPGIDNSAGILFSAGLGKFHDPCAQVRPAA